MTTVTDSLINPVDGDRIIEPFFGTDLAEGESGLGLATVHGIVVQLGGRFQVENDRNRGTRFLVLLPVVIVPNQGESQADMGDSPE